MSSEDENSDKIELLKRMIVCHADLQTSLSAITFLNEEADENEQYHFIELRRLKCYETTFVIAYGRAFTNSFGSKYKQLELGKIGLRLSEDERTIHDRIIKARSKKYVHSDLAFTHTRIDMDILEINGEGFPVHHIQWDEGLDLSLIHI